LAVTADASGLAANALTALANVCPFWSSASRLLSEVDELKKASQFDVIVATVAAEPLLDAGLLDAGLAGAELELEELELLLEQAVIAAASTRPSAGARKARWNRMRCASLGRRWILQII
jgi:hypothetical protein